MAAFICRLNREKDEHFNSSCCSRHATPSLEAAAAAAAGTALQVL